MAVFATWKIIDYVATGVGWDDVLEALKLGLFTLSRVVVLIAVASMIWVPIGVQRSVCGKSWLKDSALGAVPCGVPANLLFPVFVVAIVHFREPDIWPEPLIILGAQWYILFNVIAGTMAYPTTSAKRR